MELVAQPYSLNEVYPDTQRVPVIRGRALTPITITGDVAVDGPALDEAAEKVMAVQADCGRPLERQNAHQTLVRFLLDGDIYEGTHRFSDVEESPIGGDTLRNMIRMQMAAMLSLKSMPIRVAPMRLIEGSRLHLIAGSYLVRGPNRAAFSLLPLSSVVMGVFNDAQINPLDGWKQLVQTGRATEEDLRSLTLYVEANRLVGGRDEKAFDTPVQAWANGDLTLAPFEGLDLLPMLGAAPPARLSARFRPSPLGAKFIYTMLSEGGEISERIERYMRNLSYKPFD